MGNSGRAPDLPPDPSGPWGAAQGTASPAALKTKTAVKCAAASPPAVAAVVPAAAAVVPAAAAGALAAEALAAEAAGVAAAGVAAVAPAAAPAAGAVGAAAVGPAAAVRRGAVVLSAASLHLFARRSEALCPLRGAALAKPPPAAGGETPCLQDIPGSQDSVLPPCYL